MVSDTETGGNDEPTLDDPDLGDGASELDGIHESGDGFTYRICVLLKGGPAAARAAFCLSQPTSDVRWRCYSHLADTPVSWANWCYNEFAE